jgi:hypothetical protein
MDDFDAKVIYEQMTGKSADDADFAEKIKTVHAMMSLHSTIESLLDEAIGKDGIGLYDILMITATIHGVYIREVLDRTEAATNDHHANDKARIMFIKMVMKSMKQHILDGAGVEERKKN